MKKILIFGGLGMAGHMIYYYLKSLNKYIIYNVTKTKSSDEYNIECDILNIDIVNNIILTINPDIIINCIGILNHESDKNPIVTSYINSFFPHFLSIKSHKLIHLSTDCVFDGKKGSYTEYDIKNSSDLYGISKNIGEVINSKDLIIRTSIIGPELKENGKGLFHWFMNQINDINGYTNVYWTGVTTLELAKAIDSAIDCNLCGLYHLVPNDKISKFDLLNIIKDTFKKENINILPYSDNFCDKSLINTRNDFNFKVNNYCTMLSELKIWMNSNENLYNLYKL
ncbi:MAG: dTDP-4-dehydrorhamnose reductase family protein [Peptostreptococcaceae bacterium]